MRKEKGKSKATISILGQGREGIRIREDAKERSRGGKDAILLSNTRATVKCTSIRNEGYYNHDERENYNWEQLINSSH